MFVVVVSPDPSNSEFSAVVTSPSPLYNDVVESPVALSTEMKYIHISSRKCAVSDLTFLLFVQAGDKYCVLAVFQMTEGSAYTLTS